MARYATLTIALAFLMCSAAFAFNYRDLRNAPIASFNDDDIDMMMETFQHAMENNDDGALTEWRNEKTGHYGTVTPLDTFQQDGRTCRRVKIANYADSENHRITQLKYCKMDNTWQISE